MDPGTQFPVKVYGRCDKSGRRRPIPTRTPESTAEPSIDESRVYARTDDSMARVIPYTSPDGKQSVRAIILIEVTNYGLKDLEIPKGTPIAAVDGLSDDFHDLNSSRVCRIAVGEDDIGPTELRALGWSAEDTRAYAKATEISPPEKFDAAEEERRIQEVVDAVAEEQGRQRAEELGGILREKLQRSAFDDNKAVAAAKVEPIEIWILQNAKPAQAHPRKTSAAGEAFKAATEQGFLEMGLCEPALSGEWTSAVHLARKKDGEFRYTVDMRDVNKAIVKYAYPLPKCQDLIDELAYAQFFTTFDAKSGYWQFPLAKKSRKYTAFRSVRHGLLQWCRLPQGLAVSAAEFQRRMELILRGLTFDFCLCYIDDIVVYSKTWEEHMAHIGKVLDRLRDANVTINLRKSLFAQTQVYYLGFQVGKDGLRPDKKLLEKISNFSGPLDYEQARSFLGTTQLYRRFIYRYSDVCKPIRDAINASTGDKGKEIKNTFKWTDECSEALKTLQEKLSSEPVHRLPRPDEPYYMFTDASKYAIGCVLCQKEGDDYVIVLCDSVVLPKRKYWNTTEGEAFAVVHFTHKFAHYVDNGQEFTVFTDHTAVQHALDNPSANAKLTRWGLSLLPFRDRMFIQHWPGAIMPADFFSRHPNLLKQPGVEGPGERYRLTLVLDSGDNASSEGAETSVEPIDPDVIRAIRPEDQFEWIKAIIADEQRTCESIGEIHDLVTRGVEPHAWPASVAKHLRKGHFRLDEDGVLHFEDKAHIRRQVVPASLRLFIMSMSHDAPMAAHFKNDRFFGSVEKLFWWPKMRQDLVDWQASCEICQLNDRSHSKRKGDYKSVVVTEPMSFTAMDLVGPLPLSHDGNRYILVFTDYFTRWVEVVPIKDKKAETIARAFFSIVACRWGAPLRLLTDNGKEFTSKFMQELHVLLGTEHLLTTPYHPEADGMVERFNATLISHLAKVISYDQKNWDELLPPVVFAYRTSPHSVTGVSPFKAMTGFEARSVLDAALIKSITRTSLEDLDDVRAITRDFVRGNDQQRLNNTAAKNAGNKPNTFKTGDLVLIETHALPEEYYLTKADKAAGVTSKRGNKSRRINKFAPKFEGPFRVLSVDGNRLKLASTKTSAGGKNKKDVVAAEAEASHAKHYRLPTVSKQYLAGDDAADWLDLSNSTNTVDQIVQHKDTAEGREYLVKWFGRRDKRNNEWLRAEEFEGDRAQLIQYERRLPVSERRLEQATHGVDTRDPVTKRIGDALMAMFRGADNASEDEVVRKRPRDVRFGATEVRTFQRNVARMAQPGDTDRTQGPLGPVDGVAPDADDAGSVRDQNAGVAPMSESFKDSFKADETGQNLEVPPGTSSHSPQGPYRGTRSAADVLRNLKPVIRPRGDGSRPQNERNRRHRESGDDVDARPKRKRRLSRAAREAADQ